MDDYARSSFPAGYTLRRLLLSVFLALLVGIYLGFYVLAYHALWKFLPFGRHLEYARAFYVVNFSHRLEGLQLGSYITSKGFTIPGLGGDYTSFSSITCGLMALLFGGNRLRPLM